MIFLFSPVVSNIQRREVKLHIISPRVNSFGIQKNGKEYLSYYIPRMREC